MKYGTMDRRKSRYDGIIWFIQKSYTSLYNETLSGCFTVGKKKNIKKMMNISRVFLFLMKCSHVV